MMLDGLHAKRRGNVRFACAGTADQDDVVGFIDKVTAMKLPHERLIDLTAGKIEAVQIAVSRKARSLELVGR